MDELRQDAVAIWQAGVDAVLGDRLVCANVQVVGSHLQLAAHRWPLADIRRICVVGAGKASAAMAVGLERALGEDVARQKGLHGWVNVPANCLLQTSHIRLHAARPPGRNEPTREAEQGTRQMLRLVGALTRDDLCICLISGGGSALMPAPAEGISLEDKLLVTRLLSASGATIEQLNIVRRRLSAVKGGGLAAACRAGRLVSLILSDVIGDPLDIIASGPTVPAKDPEREAAQALEILEKFRLAEQGVPQRVFDVIRRSLRAHPPKIDCELFHDVIGNNQTACDAAAQEAERRVLTVERIPSEPPGTLAEHVGRELASRLQTMQVPPVSSRRRGGCIVSGGEPVVQLADAASRGRGGRNQQLVLAALAWSAKGAATSRLTAQELWRSRLLLSGGTDGEDGPTDAAGALLDADLFSRYLARCDELDATDFLRRNDAYTFFQTLGDGLLITGPTGTNVCDLRIGIVLPISERGR